MFASNRIVLFAALALTAATPAAAGHSAALTTGGTTIGGPLSLTFVADGVMSVFSDPGGNSDACTTVLNTGRASVRISVTGNGNSSVDVPAGGSGALCREQVSLVDLTCLAVAPSNCAVQWRLDRD